MFKLGFDGENDNFSTDNLKNMFCPFIYWNTEYAETVGSADAFKSFTNGVSPVFLRKFGNLYADGRIFSPTIDEFGDGYGNGYGWNRYGYGWGLHKGLNLSIDLSVFATFGKNAPHWGGFTQTINATYLTPLTKDNKLWMALGTYINNINYGSDKLLRDETDRLTDETNALSEQLQKETDEGHHPVPLFLEAVYGAERLLQYRGVGF